MSYYSHPSAKGGFSFKSVGKFVGKAISYATNPAGAALSALNSLTKPKAQVQVQPSDFGQIKGGVLVPTKTDIARGVVDMLPPGPIKAIAQYMQGSSSGPSGPAVQCPKGYHPNKQASPTKGAAGTYCVRNRHMNPANGRAINRAIRRAKRGMKQARQLYSLLSPGKKGRLVIRKRGK